MASRRRRSAPKETETEGFVMTPMIDIVFQLIIFFMLVMDMSKAQLEPVVLPYASKAIKEKYADPQTMVMNVLKDGTIKIQGLTYWRPESGDDDEKIIGLFENRRAQVQYQEVAGDATWVKYPLLVRCDRSTHFSHLQKILMVATHHGGVTRVQLGAKKPEGQ